MCVFLIYFIHGRLIYEVLLFKYNYLCNYLQIQIDNIRDSIEDRQSRIAWQTINEKSRGKGTAKN